MYGFSDDITPRELAFAVVEAMKKFGINPSQFFPAQSHQKELREWAERHRGKVLNQVQIARRPKGKI